MEDKGLQKVLQIATSDTTYELPCRKTVTKRIQQLYDNEKEDKENLLEKAKYVALTGDHWTSVSNSNYLGVTAHVIDIKWRLHSFALTIQKTTTRHFAENVAEDFESVAEAWEVTQEVTTIGTDSARTMTAAMRHNNKHNPRFLFNTVAKLTQKPQSVSCAPFNANDFLDFFCNKIDEIRIKINSSSLASSSNLVKNCPAADSELVSALNTFENISLEILSKIVSSSKPTTCVLDPFPAKLFKELWPAPDLQC